MQMQLTAGPKPVPSGRLAGKLALRPASLSSVATNRSASRPHVRCTAAAGGGLLGRLFGGSGGSAAAAARTARQRLLEQLSSERPDPAAVSGAVDELMVAAVPFREAQLGGGPWRVVYTRGPLLWQGPLAPRGGRVLSPGGNQVGAGNVLKVASGGLSCGRGVPGAAAGAPPPLLLAPCMPVCAPRFPCAATPSSSYNPQASTLSGFPTPGLLATVCAGLSRL